MEYYSLSQYLKDEYGEKLYKLSLSGAGTCPNRDGSLGVSGCAFCSEGGSGDFAAPVDWPLDKQMEFAKRRVAGKSHADRYIAYFQSYTGTYGDLGRLKALYTEAVNRPEVAVLSIATRPDCLGPEVMDMLTELRARKPVWIELGLQTTRPDSVRTIRRGYPNEVYADAVHALNAADIKVVTHVILGLPGETLDDMQATVQYACRQGTWGLKLQLLHILEGTTFAEEYKAGRITPLDEDIYIHYVCEILKALPEDIVIHRLTGDGPKNILLAPMWSANKREVLNRLNKAIKETTKTTTNESTVESCKEAVVSSCVQEDFSL